MNITNSDLEEHLLEINKVNCILFVHDFQSDKNLTISVENVIYLDEHVLSVSFSTR